MNAISFTFYSDQGTITCNDEDEIEVIDIARPDALLMGFLTIAIQILISLTVELSLTIAILRPNHHQL